MITPDEVAALVTWLRKQAAIDAAMTPACNSSKRLTAAADALESLSPAEGTIAFPPDDWTPPPELPDGRMAVHFDGDYKVTGVTVYRGGNDFERYIPMVPVGKP